MGFHTTALWTTGTVSLGSRGRCFFKVGVAEAEEEDGGVVVELDMDERLIVAGEGAAKETMVTGLAIGDWTAPLEDPEGAGVF